MAAAVGPPIGAGTSPRSPSGPATGPQQSSGSSSDGSAPPLPAPSPDAAPPSVAPPPPPPVGPPPPSSTSPRPTERPPAARGNPGPSACRHTSGRGGLFLGGDRPLPPPTDTIQKINVYKDDNLKLTEGDCRRLRRRLAFAISKILGSVAPFCTHPEDRLRAAVEYLEDCVPRLALCESSWGACAVLSRGLRDRKPRRPRVSSGVAATAATAAAPAVPPVIPAAVVAASAATASAGDGGGTAMEATRQQQLAQQQLDFFSQLE